MKIAKALKMKNQLAGEVAQLKDLLAKQNSRSTKQKFDYDNREVLTRLRAKLDELVKVKTAVAAANVEIFPACFGCRAAVLFSRAGTLIQVLAAGDSLDDGDLWRFDRPGAAGKHLALRRAFPALAQPEHAGEDD